mmetsp:Transcript_72551/g.146719  ORF Transcript_72551/g.146719 Transcript_72551/m.146719 type:complete len:84 (+) Transcript_72551:105-356(+)
MGRKGSEWRGRRHALPWCPLPHLQASSPELPGSSASDVLKFRDMIDAAAVAASAAGAHRVQAIAISSAVAALCHFFFIVSSVV